MFRRLSEPLPLSEASLLLFRPALNAPVLNVGYLPIGPARAAVVAFGEEYGGIGIALGVRASESGQLAILRNRESIDFDVPLAEALEPLLEEAERMGFLFDEDMLEESPGLAGRTRAMAYWADLMGGMERLLPPRSTDADAQHRAEDDEAVGPLSPSQAIAEMQYPELMLDDVAPLELADDLDKPLAIDATETLEPDLKLESEAVAARGRDFDADLDEPLEHGLDEALEGALDVAFDPGLGDALEADEWDLGAPVLGESDLTEPTAPIAAARGKAVPRPAAPQPSTPSPVAQAARKPEGAIPITAPKARPEPSTPDSAPPRAPAAPRSALPDPVRPPAAGPAPRPQGVLSKFRNPEGLRGSAGAGGGSEVGADRSSELARIPIVRVRRERNPGKRVPFLARLLSSF